MLRDRSGQDLLHGTGEEATVVTRAHNGSDESLRREFNEWAKDGRAEKLESDHLYVTERTMSLMDLKPGDRVLDLSCGSGWATRLLARRVADGQGTVNVVGVDISERMISLAREASVQFSNILYVQAPADSISLQASRFDKILSVEAFYYYPDQDRALDEMYRLLAPGGRLFILINIYRDNPSWEFWTTHLPVNAHFRSAAEYLQMLSAHGFADVAATRIPNQWQPEGGYAGVAKRFFRLFLSPPRTWFTKLSNKLRGARHDYDSRRAGSLLLMARKPFTPSV